MRHLNRLFNISTAVSSALIGGSIGFQYGKADSKKHVASTDPSMLFFSPRFRETYSGYLSSDTKVIQYQKKIDDLTAWASIVAADYDPGLPYCVNEQIAEASELHAKAVVERARYIDQLKQFTADPASFEKSSVNSDDTASITLSRGYK